MTAQQLAFDDPVPEIAVHCFFDCGHLVRGTDPQDVHDVMERHYGERHRRVIAEIVQVYR